MNPAPILRPPLLPPTLPSPSLRSLSSLLSAFISPVVVTSPLRGSLGKRGTNQFLDALGPVVMQTLKPKCAANVLSFVCGVFFRPCQSVVLDSGDTVFAPMLRCKSDCESFTEIWNECMAEIQSDEDATNRFDKAFFQLVCTRVCLFVCCACAFDVR